MAYSVYRTVNSLARAIDLGNPEANLGYEYPQAERDMSAWRIASAERTERTGWTEQRCVQTDTKDTS